MAIAQVLAIAAKLLAPSLQNLSWQNYQAMVDLVKQVEAIREANGEIGVWEEGRNLLKIIKKNFDWNRTSWWPPDKDKAKREFAKYVKKLQQAAQREVASVRQERE
jgi:hypothetical protein